MADKVVKDRLSIDVAVLCEEITEVRQTGNDHIVNLDDIYIKKDTFKNIFYPYSENFGINTNFFNSNKDFESVISFLPEHRMVNGQKFYLLEVILSNIENDLSLPRSCFTVESRVELTNQITGINTLCDINSTNILSSLTWTNILEIVNNYKLLNNTESIIIPIFVISVIFKTPTNNVENTIIRFNYKITDI
jgi:hypothetical protein